MGAIASQITSRTIVYSTVYSDAYQRKNQSSASLAFSVGNSPGTGEFPAQIASNAENVSIWWRHHARNAQSVDLIFKFHNVISHSGHARDAFCGLWDWFITNQFRMCQTSFGCKGILSGNYVCKTTPVCRKMIKLERLNTYIYIYIYIHIHILYHNVSEYLWLFNSLRHVFHWGDQIRYFTSLLMLINGECICSLHVLW